MTRAEATAFLRERYAAQAIKFPRLTAQVSRREYVARNLRRTMAMTAEHAEPMRQAARQVLGRGVQS